MGAAGQDSADRRAGAGLTLFVHALLLGILLLPPGAPPPSAERSPTPPIDFAPVAPEAPPEAATSLEIRDRGPQPAAEPGPSPGEPPRTAPPLPGVEPQRLPGPPVVAAPAAGPAGSHGFAEEGEALPGSGQTVPGTGEAGPGVGAAAGPGAGGEGGSRDPDTLAAPDWVTKPSFEEMMRLNPRWAQVEGVSGGAVLACRIDKRKKAHSCRVLSESPKGYGFADAAVRAVKLGRLKPPGANGLPQYRAWVRIPIHFRNCRDKESGCRPGVE